MPQIQPIGTPAYQHRALAAEKAPQEDRESLSYDRHQDRATGQDGQGYLNWGTRQVSENEKGRKDSRCQPCRTFEQAACRLLHPGGPVRCQPERYSAADEQSVRMGVGAVIDAVATVPRECH